LFTLLVEGILMGSIYGLIALGLTLIFGVMRIINFAHGALLMVSMFIGFECVKAFGINPYVTLIFVVPAMFVIGYLTNFLLVQPVLKKEADVREPIGALVLTFGFGVIIENSFLAIFGPNYKSIHSSFSEKTMEIGSVIIAMPKVYAFLLATVVTVLFYLFLQKTDLGRNIRAVGQDRNTARLMGINVERTFSIAFGIGLAILGTAGVVLLPFYNLHPSMGGIFSVKAFVTVLLGGLGSIPGAIIGGLLIGIVESVSTAFVQSTLAPMVVLYAFLVFLFFRPAGLFGSRHDT
jgi:Branched-chain amino acid ABC-type transport system, permease components